MHHEKWPLGHRIVRNVNMKRTHKVISVFALSASLLLSCAGCGSWDEYDDPAVKDQPSVQQDSFVEEDDPTIIEGEVEGYTDFEYKPVFDFKGTGNFTDIDESIWAESPHDPKSFVGKWYEDGFSNGYCLEMYGDGTWQIIGGNVVRGYYTVWSNGIINLDEANYGISFAQVDTYSDSDGSLVMNLTIYPDGMVQLRSSESPVVFKRSDSSVYCDDLDGFYAEKYPFMNLAGTWYPLEEDNAKNYFEIQGSGHWGEEQGGDGMLEVGILEVLDDTKYISTGANDGNEYIFEYPGDGYLYINGYQYENRTGEDLRYQYIVDTWHYYDVETGEYLDIGYEFFDDHTFQSLSGNSTEEHGTYFYVGDNLLLYDDEGNQLHRYYQDIFYARRKHILDENNENLYGEGPSIEWEEFTDEVNEDYGE